MAMIEVRKRENESPNALLYRFTKRVKRSGVLLEARKRAFHKRPPSKQKKRLAAIKREQKRQEILRMRKLGLW